MNHSDLVKNTRGMLDSVLAHQSDEGDFIGSDVHTFHFMEALRAVSAVAFRPYIDHALKWFQSLEDPRDANPRSVSPFKVAALAAAGGSDEYVRASLRKIVAIMRGKDGNINLPIGFVEASDVYDMFPTLMGVSIILRSAIPEYQSVVESALRWCASRLQDASRQGNIGFLALEMVEAKCAGYSINEAELQGCIDRLKAIIADITREVDPLQEAYLAYDCARISQLEPTLVPSDWADRIVGRLHSMQSEHEEDFYARQDRALLDLRLIIAYSAVMTADEREQFVEALLGSAFGDKVLMSRRFRQLQAEAQKMYAELKRRDLAEKKEGLFIQPLWDINVSRVDNALVFFLMPFANDSSPSHIKALNRIFQDVLRVAVESELAMSVRRADDIYDIKPIMQSVWDSILEARIVVADLTDRNPNVFYEAGLADALGKDLVLLAQHEDDIPFDLRHRRVIIYDVAYPGPDKLKTALLQTLRNVTGEPNHAPEGTARKLADPQR